MITARRNFMVLIEPGAYAPERTTKMNYMRTTTMQMVI